MIRRNYLKKGKFEYFTTSKYKRKKRKEGEETREKNERRGRIAEEEEWIERRRERRKLQNRPQNRLNFTDVSRFYFSYLNTRERKEREVWNEGKTRLPEKWNSDIKLISRYVKQFG